MYDSVTRYVRLNEKAPFHVLSDGKVLCHPEQSIAGWQIVDALPAPGARTCQLCHKAALQRAAKPHGARTRTSMRMSRYYSDARFLDRFHDSSREGER